MRPPVPADGKLDRIGGKILYRVVGMVLLVLMLGNGSAAFYAIRSGDMPAGLFFALIAIGFGFVVRWCFSSKRRLRVADPS